MIKKYEDMLYNHKGMPFPRLSFNCPPQNKSRPKKCASKYYGMWNRKLNLFLIFLLSIRFQFCDARQPGIMWTLRYTRISCTRAKGLRLLWPFHVRYVATRFDAVLYAFQHVPIHVYPEEILVGGTCSMQKYVQECTDAH